MLQRWCRSLFLKGKAVFLLVSSMRVELIRFRNWFWISHVYQFHQEDLCMPYQVGLYGGTRYVRTCEDCLPWQSGHLRRWLTMTSIISEDIGTRGWSCTTETMFKLYRLARIRNAIFPHYVHHNTEVILSLMTHSLFHLSSSSTGLPITDQALI